MKKILFAFLFGLAFSLIGASAHCAGGRQEGYQVITSTGETVINFDRETTEIYVVTGGTNTAYVNFSSSFTTTNDFALGQFGQSDVLEHTEEINSSNMAISQSTGPVHIRVKWKYW